MTHAWLTLGGPALLLNESDIEHIEKFLILVEKHDIGGKIANWDNFQEAINSLYANNADKNEPSDIKPVEILTIHKAKGLEFDTVFIPGIDKRNPSDKQELLLWSEQFDRNKNLQPIISPVHAKGDKKDPIYDYLKEIIRKKQSYESERVFYIACTRAKSSLHILGHIKEDTEAFENDKSKMENKSNIISKLRLLHGDNIKIYPTTKIANSPPQALMTKEHPNKLLRIAENWEKPKLSTNIILEEYRLSYFNENSLYKKNINEPLSLQQREARLSGILLHQTMQSITETGFNNWEQTQSTRQHVLWKIKLQQYGYDSKKITTLIDKLSRAVNLILSSKTGQWLLDNSHLDSHCEYSIWSQQGNDYKQHIIDRTFIDNRNDKPTRWIIDYKSAEPEIDQPLEEFLAIETQSHYEQLNRYRRLFTHEPYPIITALYFPYIDTLHKVLIDTV